MKNFKIVIEYDGTAYRGFQRLKDSDKTIQGKLEAVIKTLTEEDTEIIASGRTDAGVHALNQVANFKTAKDVTEKEILKHFDNYLPSDIVVKECVAVSDNFHSRYNVKEKTYLYKICVAPYGSAFERKYSYHIPKGIDLNKMNKAAKVLIGEHDFISFCNSRSKNKSTIRKINDIRINKYGEFIEIRYRATGFLHNMARIITGTLIEAGLSKITPEEVKAILSKKDRAAAGFTAPSQGLFLETVEY